MDHGSTLVSTNIEETFLQNIRNEFGDYIELKMKNWFNLNKKLITARKQRQFLLKYRTYDQVPNNVNSISQNLQHFSFHSNTGHRKFTNLVYNLKKKILNLEIEDSCIHINHLENKKTEIENELKTLIPENVFTQILKNQENYSFRYNKLLNIKLSNKYNSTINKHTPVLNNNEKWFKNFSKTPIPQNVIDILSLGHKYNTLQNYSEKTSIEYIKSIENYIHNTEIDENEANNIRGKLIDKLKNFNKKTNHINIQDRIFAKKLTETKSFLKNNKNILVTYADKGNVTVALEKTEYVNKMETILNDTQTYKKLNKNPFPLLQKSTHNLLKKWNNNGFLNKKYNRNQLTQTNTSLPKCYGLPKIHKIDIPLRPIISNINSPTHFLSKHLYTILSQNTKKPASYIKNSQNLVEKLKNLNIPEDHILISLDVKSLYTNIGKELVKQSIIRRYGQLCSKLNIPLDEFINVSEFLMDNTYFQFDHKYYKQIYGTPMGSPISGLFADFVMDDLETECLSLLSFTPLFFYRYVDDIITCIPKSKINEIIDTFNSYDNRLQFTYEIEQNNAINFLDLKLIKQDKKIIINWYHKETFSSRILNFNSYHPKPQKIAMIYNLIDTAVILTDPIFHKENIQLVKQIAFMNNYPTQFTNKYIKKRLNIIKHRYNDQHNISPKRINKKTNKISVPYKKILFEQLSHTFKQFNIELLPKITDNMSSIIKKGKDKTDIGNTNNVVYRIPCKNCKSSYVGQTKRCVKTRISEHIKNKESVIQEHTNTHNHDFDWENFQLLDQEKQLQKRLISEMLYINLQEKPLNKIEDINNLNGQYIQFFNSLRHH